MPTTEQMFTIWESEMQFGTREDERSVQGSYNSPKRYPTKFTGKKMGTIKRNIETNELEIVRFEKEDTT